MKTEAVVEDIRCRIEAGYPLFFLKTAEEVRWEKELAELALEMERGLVTWTITRGFLPPPASNVEAPPSAIQLFEQLDQFPDEHLFLIKDFHSYLNDPQVLRRMRDELSKLTEHKKTLILMDPLANVPLELEKDAIKIQLPLPDYEDLREEFDFVASNLKSVPGTRLELTENDEDRLIKAVLGLTINEARKAWTRALSGRTELSDEVFTTLIAEKRSLASGSDFLEFYDLEENVGDIGGLDLLKDWLTRRAEAYSPRAREQGVPLPKGVLLLGVQGCGKSLCARATARLLSFPLVRLDIAALLGANRGESERNLRSVLNLAESIAPVVLWMDEIEKGFAGVESGDSGKGDATIQRLVGTLLTWMADNKKPIFVAATANSVDQLPPEMLRRGRFDEMFFVDLPNFDERKNILGIHLKKRNWKPELFDVDDLARRSEGFSGAELEQIVVTALIDAFGNQRILSQDDLVRAWRATVPLSVTMEDKIFALRNWAQERCRRATSDSRVTSMLEAEHRNDQALESSRKVDAGDLPAWAQLANSGQIKAGLVEFVRSSGDVLFPDVVDAMSSYIDAVGDQGLAIRSNPNVVVWAGLSQRFCDMICDLISSKRLYIHPAELDRYKSVQKGIKLPILKEPTDERVPRAVWLPASLRTSPHRLHAARLSRIGRIKLNGG